MKRVSTAVAHSLAFAGIVLGVGLGIGALAWMRAPQSLARGADFSAYWLGAWWVRALPPDTPLYYPCEADGRPNSRLLGMIRDERLPLLRPWLAWSRQHGIPSPKFFIYPPAFALAFAPLTHLSITTAAGIWAVGNAVAYVAALALLALLTRPDNWRRPTWLLLPLGLGLCFYPAWWSLDLGQNSLLLLLAWCALLAALARGWELAAGVLLGTLVLVKLNPVILIPWLLWRRRWRAVAWAGATVIALLGVSAWAAGAGNVLLYFRRIVPLLATGTHYYENQSLAGFLLRLAPHRDVCSAPPGVMDGVPHRWMTGLSLLGVALTGLPMLTRARSNEEQMRIEFACLVLLILVISPITWTHHLVNALIPIFVFLPFVLKAGKAGRALRLLPLIAAAVLLAVPSPPVDWVRAMPPWLLSFRLLGLCLLGVCGWRIRMALGGGATEAELA